MMMKNDFNFHFLKNKKSRLRTLAKCAHINEALYHLNKTNQQNILSNINSRQKGVITFICSWKFINKHVA